VADTLFTDAALSAVGWALVHFIWQGALLGAATAAALAALRGARANVRYVVAAVALALMLVAPVITAQQVYQTHIPTAFTIVAASDAAISMPETAGAIASRPLSSSAAKTSGASIEAMLPYAVAFWIAGVLLLSVRLACGWYAVERLRRRGVGSVTEPVEERVRELSARLGLSRPVRIIESALVAVPAVVGWLRPVILLPASVATGLPTAHLDAVLAHELAHVRRHDYLVNAMQAVVETLLFYHPAVWWCSRQMRIEREHCCDDLAVQACGDRVAYATALANLEDLRRAGMNLALAVTGGSLLDRVRRVLGAPPAHDARARVWAAAISIALVAILGVTAGTVTRAERRTQTSAARADRLGALPDDSRRSEADSARMRRDSERLERPLESTAPVAGERTRVQMLHRGTPLDFLRDILGIRPLAAAPPGAPAPPAAANAPAPAAAAQRPAPPAAPAPPSPPSAPARPPRARRDTTVSWSESNRDRRTTITQRGTFTLNDADDDIVSISPGGYFIVTESAWWVPSILADWIGIRREVELRARADGTMVRRYYSGDRQRPYVPAGREWLRALLPELVRRTGIVADARVARILKQDGAAGVVGEIDRLESDYVRSIYVRELVKQTALVPGDLNIALRAAQRIGSDYQQAETLMAIARFQTIDAATAPAYFDGVDTIGSDYERRRVLSAFLDRTVDAAVVAALFRSAATIGSDYEQAEFLIGAARRGLDVQATDPFFAAVETIGSDYEHRRVLATIAGRPKATDATLEALLQSSRAINSDYEQAELLVALARGRRFDGRLRSSYLDAAESIGSEHERTRAMVELLRTERAAR
jgi:beta-lactamase regulating signal transducer with metallopeptidase domain